MQRSLSYSRLYLQFKYMTFILTSLSAVQIYDFHIFTVVYLNIVENQFLAAVRSFPFTFLSLQRNKYQCGQNVSAFFLLKKFYLLASIVNGVTLRPLDLSTE